ncbi:MAG: hypothetical protein R3B09_13490 [Nannocystaceae bacterium]
MPDRPLVALLAASLGSVACPPPADSTSSATDSTAAATSTETTSSTSTASTSTPSTSSDPTGATTHEGTTTEDPTTSTSAASTRASDPSGDTVDETRGGPDLGALDEPYVGPPCTRSFRAAPGASDADKLEAAIADAITDRCFLPPVEEPPASAMGPKEAQGVVRIEYDPRSPDFAGANALLFDRPVALEDGLRIEIDAGVRLVYTHYENGALFNLDKRRDVTLTRGDPAHGEGRRAGRYVLDASTDPPPVDGVTKMIARAVWLKDTDRFLVEHVHTVQSWRTDTAAIIFNGSPTSAAPRNGIYRHHSNEGSPQGYGPNQITSLNDSYIHDLWSEGGTTCRFETDGNHSGVHRVIVDLIYGQRGNRVLVLMPYEESSDTLTVTRIRGVGMYEGIRVGDQPGDGIFTGVTVDDGCIVAGDDAQSQVKTGDYPDPFPLQVSRAVVEWGPPMGTDVTITGIGYSEADAKFKPGPGPVEHGVDAEVPCTKEFAQSGL